MAMFVFKAGGSRSIGGAQTDGKKMKTYSKRSLLPFTTISTSVLTNEENESGTKTKRVRLSERDDCNEEDTQQLFTTRRVSLFTSLSKKKKIVTPLHERNANSTVLRSRLQQVKPRLSQMFIDLGTKSVAKSCGLCGMNYICSTAEDQRLHRRFCADNAVGVRLPSKQGKVFSKIVMNGNMGRRKEYIAVVGRTSSTAEKEIALRVLKIASTELGAALIEKDDLWCEKRVGCFFGQECSWHGLERERNDHVEAEHPIAEGIGSEEASRFCLVDGCCFGRQSRRRMSEQEFVEHLKLHSPSRSDCKVYLYITDGAVTSCLLAVPISHAYRVNIASPLAISEVPQRAILGIERIWTARKRRRTGNATQLLNILTDNWEHGLELDKEDIAWSWTTDEGKSLAVNWWKAETGWAVYVE